MLTTKDRVTVVEERVDSLESLFGHFLTEVGGAVRRMERTVAEMKAEGARDRQEWNKRWEASEAAATESRRELNRKWGELAHRLGTVAEDIVAPNIPRIAREHFGWDDVEDLMVRRRVRNKRDASKRREFDVVAVGADQVIINETKVTAKKDYIDEFIAVLPEIFDYFPEYAGKVIVPIFASLSIDEGLINYLTKHRIYAMDMGDETMDLVNFAAVHDNA